MSLTAATDRSSQTGEKAIIRLLGQLGGSQVKDSELTFEGTKFIIPAQMSVRQAIKFLQRRLEQDEETSSYERTFNFRPWDGAHALQSALKKTFGTAGIGKTTYSFFGPNPPQLKTINVGIDETAQVPWGAVSFPALEATLHLGATRNREKGLLFRLTVEAPTKYAAHVNGLFKVIEEELKVGSIYRGKAFNGAEEPDFINPWSVDKRKVVYTEDVTTQLDANVWGLIEHTAVQEKMGMPLKRAVLLAGPYGTGKSLAAMLTAQKAEEHEWTFIQCRPGRDDLPTVMQTAQLYQPAVVFFEDVDTISSMGDRQAVANLLDLFDGITAKGTKLLIVMTTNHPEQIHKGMVRPGRLDAVIRIEALDGPAKEALIKATVPDALLAEDMDYSKIDKAMEGFLPAFIKEAIDRAVRYAIVRSKGEPDQLTTSDFVGAALSLRAQHKMMEDAGEGKLPDNLGQALSKEVHEAAVQVLSGARFVDSDGQVTFVGGARGLEFQPDGDQGE